MRRRGEIVVALHAGAVADDRRHRDALARAQIGAVEAGAGHQHHAADAGRGRCAAGFASRPSPRAPPLRLRPRGARARPSTAPRGSSRSRSGKSRASSDGIGEPDIFVVGRNARHRHRALGKLRNAVAADVVGRDHRLPLSDQHAQADIVAFRALGFLDAAVAHLDALRDAAHRDRIGGIGAGAFRGLDQPLRERRQRGLIEQVGGGGFRRKRDACDGEEFTNKIPEIEGGCGRRAAHPPDVPNSQRTSSILQRRKPKISALPQGLVNHVSQGLVNHAGG